jgi:exopolysaccharide biosynthesis polyprenyl glycosylphosphotransferase
MDQAAGTQVSGIREGVGEAWDRPRRLLANLDAVATALTLWVGYALLPLHGVDASRPRLAHGIFQLLIGLVLLGLLYRDGQYSQDHRMSRMADVASAAKNLTVAFFLVSGLSFVTKGFFTGYLTQSRLVIFGGLLLLFALLVANRVLLTEYQRRLFARGEDLRAVVVIGDGLAAAEFHSFIDKRPWLGIGCAGTVPVRDGAFSLEQVKRVLDACRGCELILALDPEERSEFGRITQELEAARLPFRIVPSLFEESFRATILNGFHELPIINVDVDPLDRVQRTMKRILDVIVSSLTLVLLSPLLGLIALAIKLDSPGPVIFRQERVGLRGRRFLLLKFRTMVKDAEHRLDELLARNEADGHLFKIKRDPRVTRVGALLRRWSLDEFPQFVNVFWGEMSVVGPRPALPREVDEYETQHYARLKGKPGITGLWQVSGRSNLTFDEMVKLDRYYLERWSIGMDLGIIVRTVYVVLARRGAY